MSGEGKVRLKNDDARLKIELDTLKAKNKPLYDLLFNLADWVKEQIKKDLVITGIYRTIEEQAAIYKNNAKFKARPFTSPHQLWDAFDLRDSTFTKEETPKIVKYLNDTYNTTNIYKFTAMDHNVGSGWHFHVQYKVKK
jgi:hypothetical protein